MVIEYHGGDRLSIPWRAHVHRALGDPRRLAIVDALRLSDRTPTELSATTGLSSNLLAFHLSALEDAGIVARQSGHGDGRRRYVRLRYAALTALDPLARIAADLVLFVCTHNSARSQLAAALWHERTGRPALSAGAHPAARVHPLALSVARRHGLDLSGANPQGYEAVTLPPDLVVSVCDRAREAGLPFAVPDLHWSISDPVHGDEQTFEQTFADLERRVGLLATACAPTAS